MGSGFGGTRHYQAQQYVAGAFGFNDHVTRVTALHRVDTPVQIWSVQEEDDNDIGSLLRLGTAAIGAYAAGVELGNNLQTLQQRWQGIFVPPHEAIENKIAAATNTTEAFSPEDIVEVYKPKPVRKSAVVPSREALERRKAHAFVDTMADHHGFQLTTGNRQTLSRVVHKEYRYWLRQGYSKVDAWRQVGREFNRHYTARQNRQPGEARYQEVGAIGVGVRVPGGLLSAGERNEIGVQIREGLADFFGMAAREPFHIEYAMGAMVGFGLSMDNLPGHAPHIHIPSRHQVRFDRLMAAGLTQNARNLANRLRPNQNAKLLPGEGKVDTFAALTSIRQKGDNLTPHHLPQAAYMERRGVARRDAIAIMMEQPTPGTGGRHRATRTYGRAPDFSRTPRQELALDILDLRQIYREASLYNAEIRQQLQQVIQRWKTGYPSLFEK